MSTLSRGVDDALDSPAALRTSEIDPGLRSSQMTAHVFSIFLVDVVVTIGSLFLAKRVRFDDPGVTVARSAFEPLSGTRYSIVVLALAAAWLLTLAAHGGYRRGVFGVGLEEYKRIIKSTAMLAGAVAVVCYLGRIDVARGFLAVAFPVGAVGLVLGRSVARKWLHRQRERGHLVRRVLVVGDHAHVGQLVSVLRRESYLGYAVVGACLPTYEDDFLPAEDIPVFGGLSDVAAVANSVQADTVAVTAVSGSGTSFLRHLAWSLEGVGVELVVVPSLTDIAGPRIQMRPVAGLPLLHVREPEFTGLRRLSKAAFDRVAACTLLLLVSPLFLAIAAGIKFGDGGPVFFRQIRVGTNGEEFSCWKFRSMVTDADKRIDSLRTLNDYDDILFKIRKDPRVTSVGRFLRRSSLDELPQLINVLLGQMSLVGPRPPLPTEVRLYGDDVRRRLLVRPGITGLWQISGRSDLSWEDTVRLDLYYVENWSFFGDVLILAKTVRAVFSGSGAY
ncbi:MAG: sugar transferase [Geodermatophilaceae bacterium]